MGVQGKELEWFKDYLFNRQQFVFLNGTCSSLLTIKTGVPQSSILGPLLFLIYVNDLPNASCLLTLLFADDTTLMFSHSDIHELISIVNTEFRKVVEFFRSHKLSLHPLKTKFMVFSNSQEVKNMDINLFINCNNSNENDLANISLISRVNPTDDVPSVRFLDVHLDPFFLFLYILFISFYILKYNRRHTINTICGLLVGPLYETGVARIVMLAMTGGPAEHADR